MPLYAPRLPLIGTNGTITASTPLLDLSQTWNNAAVQFTGIKTNITNTASLATSYVMDLQVGGVSQFNVNAFGAIGAPGGFFGGLVRVTSNTGDISIGSANDVRLYRDAANTFGQRNGTNPQAFNVYNTYTDASNYEVGYASWAANVFRIGTTYTGTGVNRTLSLQTAGTARWNILNTGDLVAGVDNTYDIGASGATRPRNVYVGTDITAGGGLNLGSASNLTFSTRSVIRSPGDSVVTLLNNAGTDFNRLQFGGTTSSFPGLYRTGTQLQAVLADNTAYTSFRASVFVANNGSRFTDSGDGIALLYNGASTDFGRLQFGGTSASFPALKRSGVILQSRVADDTGYANFQAFTYYFANNSRMQDTADGVIQLSNNAVNDFNRIMFGGSTSAFPALKRNGTTLEVKLADDSGFASLSVTALNPAIILVASLPTAVGRTGQMRFVSDASGPVFGSAVTGGGAVNVPVYSDGTVWRVG
jgi:hypothetical protein